MRISFLFVVLAVCCCLLVNASVNVEVDVSLSAHHGHGHGHPMTHPLHHEGAALVDEASTDPNADDEVADDGTAHMRKPKVKFDPSTELPMVEGSETASTTTAPIIPLDNQAAVAALRRGAAGRGITNTNFDLHLTRIVNQFNIVNGRLNLGRALEVLAYVLATAEHETGRYKWLAEIGGPHTRYAPYYGRGYVQLTWKQNYVRYNTKLHNVGLLTADQNIVTNPNFLSQNTQASRDCMAFIIIDGMVTGAFGKPVINFINANKLDYINARRSVNILDKAAMIAGYAKAWATILQKAKAAAATAPTQSK